MHARCGIHEARIKGISRCAYELKQSTLYIKAMLYAYISSFDQFFVLRLLGKGENSSRHKNQSDVKRKIMNSVLI